MKKWLIAASVVIAAGALVFFAIKANGQTTCGPPQCEVVTSDMIVTEARTERGLAWQDPVSCVACAEEYVTWRIKKWPLGGVVASGQTPLGVEEARFTIDQSGFYYAELRTCFFFDDLSLNNIPGFEDQDEVCSGWITSMSNGVNPDGWMIYFTVPSATGGGIE